jgi:protein TonB
MENKKDPKFLKLPKFPGGKEAFQEFIKQNLKYPKAAFDNKTEGTVYLMYRVDGMGDVIEVQITKGIGFGCDEEAARVIKLMKYEKAKNRGLRVIATMRTRINFKLPKAPEIQFEYKTETKPSNTATKKTDKPAGESYEYTITF